MDNLIQHNTSSSHPRWQFWIDVGGTFTDCLAVDPAGKTTRTKVLSSGEFIGRCQRGSTAASVLDRSRSDCPDDFWIGYTIRFGDGQHRQVVGFDSQAGVLALDRSLDQPPEIDGQYRLVSGQEAPILAIRYLLGLPLDQVLPAATVRCGTTRGTNALLTRTGARCALAITRGFADLPRIGDQSRPHLFQLAIRKPDPIFETVVEINERIAADGTVLQSVVDDVVRDQLTALRERGIDSLAICLLHAYAFADHERRVETIARDVGFREVTRSSEVAPVIKIVPRCDTTVADAYLHPILREYLQCIRQSLGEGSELRFMTSAGGLHGPDAFRGKDSLYSGPAGGVVGMARASAAAGFASAIGYDMGGTSTDVSRYDGEFDYVNESRKNGVHITGRSLAIETIAAGGGSICRFDGVRLTVGPDSAGADPGPACYGRGGPLTITDANLVLGRILPHCFPFHLDIAASQRRLQELTDQIRHQSGQQMELYAVAAGCIRVANAHMARAVETVTLRKGCDPRGDVLVPFGGAAPQHAGAIAELLGIRKVIVHRDAGLLSAVGIGLADVAFHDVQSIYRLLDEESLQTAGSALSRLQAKLRDQVLREGVPPAAITSEHALDVRYAGQDAALTIKLSDDTDIRRAFEDEHRQRYGYIQKHRAVEIVAARVQVRGHVASDFPRSTSETLQEAEPDESAHLWLNGKCVATPVFRWDSMKAGACLKGPAVVVESHATTVVDPGWQAEMLTNDQLLLTQSSRNECSYRSPTTSTDLDLVLVEIFYHAFMAIAEQMGVTLQRTATSVNVKERLDFSCAIFSALGDLVANAPHVPVHLGAMSETVRAVVQDHPDLQSGDVVVTNDPYRGGSHLPDVTVVTPVFLDDDREVFCFVACRAHHAEIGGMTPGSMPPHSRRLSEEGILIRSMKVVQASQLKLDLLEQLLTTGPYPSRAVPDNLADITAQIAANQLGLTKMLQLTERHGGEVVTAYMQHVQDAAAAKLALELKAYLSSSGAGFTHPAAETSVPHPARSADPSTLPPASGGEGRVRGSRESPSVKRNEPTQHLAFLDHLDDGSSIAVNIDIATKGLTIDFTGSAGVHAGNLNANPAIVRAAVIYVLRCLIAEDIPLNEGIMQGVKLRVPAGILSPPDLGAPDECAAVVGGNVETSQRIVDVLIGALGLAAASQGTMNNVLFGDASFGYYETICGGAGATAGGPGADAVHTHMTNTRLTDPEVLEQRYPVRLLDFSIRRGSGGSGRFRGGNGVIRRLQFLRPADLSILSQRRENRPYGQNGGRPGQPGRNLLFRGSGDIEWLGPIASAQVQIGDILQIETPGGGGFAAP